MGGGSLSLGETFWTLRWHVARIFVGNTTWLLAAAFDGLKAFRREFMRTFGNRWRAKDRAEFRRRWEASRLGERRG